MVKNIDFTIFVSIYPFVSLIVSSLVLFDRSFVHLFVCSCVCGRVVILSSGRLVVCSAGRFFVCFFLAFGRLFVWSCDRLVILLTWSFDLFFVCSSVLDLFISCLFRGSFPGSCLLLWNIPRFKVHLESAAAYRERSHKRHKWKRQGINTTFSGKHSKPWPRCHSPLHYWRKNPTADDTNGMLAFVHSFLIFTFSFSTPAHHEIRRSLVKHRRFVEHRRI